ILTLFFKPVKKKKAVKIGLGMRRSTLEGLHSELVLDAGDVLSPEEVELFNTLDGDEDHINDESQTIHDMHIAISVRDRAIADMRAKGVTVRQNELREAEVVLYKVAGLAKRVNDSGRLKSRFESLVDAAAKDPNSPITGEKHTLDRRVSTRWNSDLACLDAYFLLYPIVEQLTAVQEFKLQNFVLSDTQLHLAKELCDILLIVEGPTRLFSQANVPLIANIIPMLLVIQQALTRASEDTSQPSVLRIAAYAGTLVCKKYYALADECEIYYIAIVMSPDKKLD
ncbi:uncharacterized protein FOMMEDRAFT_98270, partial [Fomitiporia mediterranea MF3/22]